MSGNPQYDLFRDSKEPALLERPSKEFIINDHLSVGLFKEKSGDFTVHAMVDGRRIVQCVHVFITGAKQSFAEVECIDQIVGRTEAAWTKEAGGIDEETALVGHSSNIQAWAENDYDSRILSVDVARPLLAALAKAGDKKANNEYMASVMSRWFEGSFNSKKALILYNEHEINKLVQDGLIKPDDILAIREAPVYYSKYSSSSPELALFVIDGNRISYNNMEKAACPTAWVSLHHIIWQYMEDAGGIIEARRAYETMKATMSRSRQDRFTWAMFARSLTTTDPSDEARGRGSYDVRRSLVYSGDFERKAGRWNSMTVRAFLVEKEETVLAPDGDRKFWVNNTDTTPLISYKKTTVGDPKCGKWMPCKVVKKLVWDVKTYN